MIDLDEFALCTHEEADTMIFVHTNHATKGGCSEGVLMAKASDTDILLEQSVWCHLDLSTAAVNCIWPRSALEMDSCPWTVRLHRAKEEQGRSRLHQSRDFMLMLCLHSATKEKRCDEITDVFHKLSQFSSSGIDDDMEILVRFVSECMTDPAQLRASTMQDWVCLRGAVTRRATVFQPDIASSADWVWTKKTIFGRSPWHTFYYCGEMPAAD